MDNNRLNQIPAERRRDLLSAFVKGLVTTDDFRTGQHLKYVQLMDESNDYLMMNLSDNETKYLKNGSEITADQYQNETRGMNKTVVTLNLKQ